MGQHSFEEAIRPSGGMTANMQASRDELQGQAGMREPREVPRAAAPQPSKEEVWQAREEEANREPRWVVQEGREGSIELATAQRHFQLKKLRAERQGH